ncbi:WSC domain-containing protein [Nemania sp. FL0916]|nr:WSC domain-containing protein [Nemania sp. FL0916]
MFPNTRAITFVGIAVLTAQADAFWRLPCASPVVVERADPIMNPNAVSTHVHTVMGSNAFNFTMAYDDTQAAGCSTCKVIEDKSNYWVPSLWYQAQNGSFIDVKQNGGGLIYYLQRSDPSAAEGLVAFPKGFRMVAGTQDSRNYTDTLEQRAISFVCLGTEGPATSELPNKNCPDGLRTQLIMPSCWDGQNLGSPDHKSHMAYPSGLDNGVCPNTHPKRFITLFYEVTWNVDHFKDNWYGNTQPFVFSNGDTHGYGYHADFMNGWDLPTLQKAIDECNSSSGNIEDCGAFTLRDDDDMAACKVLPRVNETITGVLPALPGCNPIDSDAAVQRPDCRTATQIGDPILPFTDMTQKLGWKYTACAKDPAGQSRTLTGAFSDQPDMTGFQHAGLEFRSQCFCGNDIPQDRMPTNGTLGDCSMTCAGNSNEFCGGAARVSIYSKCADPSYCLNYEGSYLP